MRFNKDNLTMAGKKVSVVWDFFHIHLTDETKAVCTLCNSAISHGSVKLKDVRNLLEPMEKLTQDFSSHDAHLSAIIPAILGLKLALEHSSNDAGVKLMKTHLVESVEKRFEPLST